MWQWNHLEWRDQKQAIFSKTMEEEKSIAWTLPNVTPTSILQCVSWQDNEKHSSHSWAHREGLSHWEAMHDLQSVDTTYFQLF